MSEMRLASGHWMAFYSAALVILYSAIQIQKKGLVRKCPNGLSSFDRVQHSAIDCGQLILDEVVK